MFSNLALSGGAHLCIPFVGFLRAVAPLLEGVRCVSGCSGGALVAAAWVLDVPVDCTLRTISKHMGAGLLRDPDLASLIDRMGLVDPEDTVGAMCKELIGEGLAHWRSIKKGIEPDPGSFDGASATMLDLAKLTGKSLAIGACDASRGFTETYITAESHPGLEVWRALSASCAIPFAFAPVPVGDSLLCDPCVRDGSPVRGIPGEPTDGMVDTLAVEVRVLAALAAPPHRPPRGVLEFGKGVLAAMIERVSVSDPQPRARVVFIPRWTEDVVGPMVVGTDAAAIVAAYEQGVSSGEEFLALVYKGS